MHSSHGQWLMEIFQICVGNVVDGVTTATTAGNYWSFSLWIQTASLRRRHPRACVRPSIINKIYTLRNTMTREMLKCPSFAIYKAWVRLVRELGIRSWMSCLLVCLIRASFVCLLHVSKCHVRNIMNEDCNIVTIKRTKELGISKKKFIFEKSFVLGCFCQHKWLTKSWQLLSVLRIFFVP